MIIVDGSQKPLEIFSDSDFENDLTLSKYEITGCGDPETLTPRMVCCIYPSVTENPITQTPETSRNYSILSYIVRLVPVLLCCVCQLEC